MGLVWLTVDTFLAPPGNVTKVTLPYPSGKDPVGDLEEREFLRPEVDPYAVAKPWPELQVIEQLLQWEKAQKRVNVLTLEVITEDAWLIRGSPDGWRIIRGEPYPKRDRPFAEPEVDT